MSTPAYPAAHAVAATIESYFSRHLAAAARQEEHLLAPQPDAKSIEAIIDAAFWASLRHEEGYSAKISLAFLPIQQAKQPLIFEQPLPMLPSVLSRIAPAVERPGIHLGVWHTNGQNGELRIWGTTRTIPKLCCVLEVIEPGLLVVKYRRSQETGKYVNVAVLKGDQIKVLDERGTNLPDCPELLTSLLGFGWHASETDSVNALMQLAVSMRAHGRGGSLLVVPRDSNIWQDSILQPVNYSVSPPFSELAELMRKDETEKSEQTWQEAFIDAVDALAGLTAVDGVVIVNDAYELLAFGAKTGRRDGGTLIEKVVVTEPVVGNVASAIHPLELGGTRHLSAGQFVQDQRDSMALVASQDGRFTVFAWSPCEGIVHCHRIESLLM